MFEKIYLQENLALRQPAINRGGYGGESAGYTQSVDLADWVNDGIAAGEITSAGGGGGSQTLTIGTPTSTVIPISISGGNTINLPLSSSVVAGLQSPSDNVKLNQISFTNTNVVNLTNLVQVLGTSDNHLGVFTGSTIPDNSTVVGAFQLVETAIESKQNAIQFKQSGTNTGTLGQFTKYNFIGATVSANGGDSTQADVTITSGATTNTLTAASSVITSTVNGTAATLTPAAGTITQNIGFDSTGNLVKQAPAVAQSNIIISGGASIKYNTLTGTPVVSYAKAAGTGTLSVTGGTIQLVRFDDVVLDSDRDGNTDFKWNLVGTGTNLLFAKPFSIQKQTLNASNTAADASTNATISNQFDTDNTPPVKYGNIVLTGQGSITLRSNNIPTSANGDGNGFTFTW